MFFFKKKRITICLIIEPRDTNNNEFIKLVNSSPIIKYYEFDKRKDNKYAISLKINSVFRNV